MGDFAIAPPPLLQRAADRIAPVSLDVVVSPGVDPVPNLALEDAFLAEVDAGTRGDTLRLWVSGACLVRGPNRSRRNGWHRPEVAQSLGVPIYERSSGGGTVYHDAGNLNWSFFLRRAAGYFGAAGLFRACAGFIVDALRPLGIAAAFAAPNRIDVAGRKVSGIAARASLEAVLVHGTLLVSSDLERINALCIYPPGCPPVQNLAAFTPGLTVGDAIGAIALRARAFAAVSSA